MQIQKAHFLQQPPQGVPPLFEILSAPVQIGQRRLFFLDEKKRDREQAELDQRSYTGEAIVRELRRWQALHATFTALNQGYCH
ncbi:hypothetical protein [Kyrpidia tusciae]|uniref:hypothetical protein n=1 Tax=Kyrpidia tusciae TaxID=33943 RepID=UPI000F4DB625|nr:hypothetical protein [Kyrpidia tusciae]